MEEVDGRDHDGTEAIRTSVLLYPIHLEIMERMAEVWPVTRGNQSRAVRVAIEQVDYQMRTPGRHEMTRDILRGVNRLLEILDPASNTIEAARAAGCDNVDQFDDNGMDLGIRD